jgi:hypothetical protein
MITIGDYVLLSDKYTFIIAKSLGNVRFPNGKTAPGYHRYKYCSYICHLPNAYIDVVGIGNEFLDEISDLSKRIEENLKSIECNIACGDFVVCGITVTRTNRDFIVRNGINIRYFARIGQVAVNNYNVSLRESINSDATVESFKDTMFSTYDIIVDDFAKIGVTVPPL